MTSHIQENLKRVRDDINKAIVAANRDPKDVTLIAVSKTFPLEYVQEAYHLGQRAFGENKVQELEAKVPNSPSDIEWHLIGHLQSNKAAKAVELADYIHAVDSVKLIERLDRLAGEKGRKPKIFLEVNISGEESKFGVASDDAFALAEAALAAKNLELVGLMTMAPYGADEETLKNVFAGARDLLMTISEKYDAPIHDLSMGMSGDYPAAIKYGSTMLRIGTAIFGKR